jgi:hypothetical protein
VDGKFVAILAPPPGAALATQYQLKSGAVAMLDGESHLTVSDERDYLALVQSGWQVVAVTRE